MESTKLPDPLPLPEPRSAKRKLDDEPEAVEAGFKSKHQKSPNTVSETASGETKLDGDDGSTHESENTEYTDNSEDSEGSEHSDDDIDEPKEDCCLCDYCLCEAYYPIDVCERQLLCKKHRLEEDEENYESSSESDEGDDRISSGFEASRGGQKYEKTEEIPYRWVSGEDDTGMDFGKIQNPAVVHRSKAAKLVHKMVGSYPLSNDALDRARQYLENPKPRVIQIIWNHQDREWVWNNSKDIDQLPFLVTLLNNHYKKLARILLKPAPRFGNIAPYPLFNFNLDTLKIEYPRCGTEHCERLEHTNAIEAAASTIKKFADDNPLQLTVKHIEVTYCLQPVGASGPGYVIQGFENIRGLQSLHLNIHPHWNKGRYWGKFRSDRDDVLMQVDVDDPAFEEGAYSFKVTMDMDG